MTAGALREQVWNTLAQRRIATYPTPPHGHHPNFVGSGRAAQQLVDHPVFSRALTVLVGPEQVLKPVREAVLRSGRCLLMPHPDRGGQILQLQNLAPSAIQRVRDVVRYGQLVDQTLIAVDLVVVGCVAVDRLGGWLGKGYGFPQNNPLLTAPWATLAHPAMVFDQLPLNPEKLVQLIATPLECLVTHQGLQAAR